MGSVSALYLRGYFGAQGKSGVRLSRRTTRRHEKTSQGLGGSGVNDQ